MNTTLHRLIDALDRADVLEIVGFAIAGAILFGGLILLSCLGLGIYELCHAAAAAIQLQWGTP